MEKYKIKKQTLSQNVIQFDYFDEVYKMKKEEFGIESAQIIKNNVLDIVYEEILQLQEPRNLLVVGKVQSGKTANLELLTALLFDNNYKVGIIFGGYDTNLLDQTINRFKETFKDKERFIFIDNQYGQKNIANTDAQIVNKFINNNRKIIFICMKNPSQILSVATLMKELKLSENEVFIIDDEGDQASLNTEFKKNKSSATYENIKNLIDNSNSPLYLSVTATPHANIFLPDFSKLKPERVALIAPGPSYHGGDTFHTDDKYLSMIPMRYLDDIQDLSPYIMEALFHFIISSAILYKTDKLKDTNMVFHTSQLIDEHNRVRNTIQSKIDSLEDFISSDDFEPLYSEIDEKFDRLNIDTEFKVEELYDSIIEVIKNLSIVLHNSKSLEGISSEYQHYKINIGGNLLQRGVTFKNLVTIFFTRMAKTSVNMDTTLQRARWFGYRTKTLSLTKIYTSAEIGNIFAELNEVENDLWDQFEDVYEGRLSLNDITITDSNPLFSPSRSNVIDVSKISFRRKWYSQKLGIFEESQLRDLNQSVETLVKNYNFKDITDGSLNNRVTGKILSLKMKTVNDFFKTNNFIFNTPLFKDIINQITNDYEELDIIIMENQDRVRSFSSNEVSALQQGADSTDERKRKYRGDSFVISDQNKPTIQVHMITPKIDGDINEGLKQPMFSIFLPVGQRVFSRRTYDR